MRKEQSLGGVMGSEGRKPFREQRASQPGAATEDHPRRSTVYRASPPRPPELTAALKRQLEAHESYRREREQVERRSVVRGLILLALLTLSGSILRAGLGRVFVHGWWRP